MSASELEIINTETGELVPYTPPTPPATLFRSDEPQEILQHASALADTLAPVIRQRKLAVAIQGREHVLVEGWTLLGTMLGVFPVCTWTRPVEGGWEARVEARTKDGAIVGSAEAQCTRSESTWARRDDYALRSMAQTRATSKALRQPLGFVLHLAGFSATPAEEMQAEGASNQTAASTGAAPPLSITEKQIPMVERLIRKLDETGTLDEATTRRGMQDAYGTGVTEELTKQQASDLITRLKVAAGEETS